LYDFFPLNKLLRATLPVTQTRGCNFSRCPFSTKKQKSRGELERLRVMKIGRFSAEKLLCPVVCRGGGGRVYA